VVPLFQQQRATGRLTVTDPTMTRFWITLEKGVCVVLKCLERMQGGEVFVPKIPSMQLQDLMNAIAPECERDVIGIRPGEKLHEVLVSTDEARQAVEYDDMFVILPSSPWSARRDLNGGRPVAAGFSYGSEENPERLSLPDFISLAGGAGV
jgi:UDP-N-acetylglucosamine 4,6-dehydratase